MVGRAILAAAVLILTSSGAALAAPPDGSSLYDRRAYYADQAIEKASKQVERDHACRRRPPAKGPIDGAPSAAFQSSLAALRRPAQPGEDVGLLKPFSFRTTPSVYRDYIRVITAPDGTTIDVFPMHDVSHASPRPKRCVAELRERVRRAISDRPRAFKKVARQRLRSEIAELWEPRQREGMLVLSGGTGLLTDLGTFRRYGVFRFGSSSGQAVGLVPDGVASVDFTFRRFEPTGYWSKHHPVTHRSHGTVTGNVVTYTAPTTLRDGIINDQVWRDSAGRVIREISGL